MFLPQMDWITDESGKVIVSFIGKFEQFSTDFDKICSYINISASLPHLKKSNRTHYKDYYNEESKKIIEIYFEKDINYFEYRF